MTTATQTAFPDFDLPRLGGGRLTREQLDGRPWIAYLSRHTGCSVCQAHLLPLIERREEIRAAGGELVVLFPAPLEHVEGWARRVGAPADMPVAADPDAELYEAIGTHRASMGKLVRNSLTAAVRELKGGNAPRLTSADMMRLGADAVVGADGSLVLLHLAEGADDRKPADELIGALSQAHVEG